MSDFDDGDDDENDDDDDDADDDGRRLEKNVSDLVCPFSRGAPRCHIADATAGSASHSVDRGRARRLARITACITVSVRRTCVNRYGEFWSASPFRAPITSVHAIT